MKPERSRELAIPVAKFWKIGDTGLQQITEAILQACAEQKEQDARLMEIMSGQISELTEQFDSSRAEGAFNALVNGASAIRRQD